MTPWPPRPAIAAIAIAACASLSSAARAEGTADPLRGARLVALQRPRARRDRGDGLHRRAGRSARRGSRPRHGRRRPRRRGAAAPARRTVDRRPPAGPLPPAHPVPAHRPGRPRGPDRPRLRAAPRLLPAPPRRRASLSPPYTAPPPLPALLPPPDPSPVPRPPEAPSPRFVAEAAIAVSLQAGGPGADVALRARWMATRVIGVGARVSLPLVGPTITAPEEVRPPLPHGSSPPSSPPPSSTHAGCASARTPAPRSRGCARRGPRPPPSSPSRPAS